MGRYMAKVHIPKGVAIANPAAKSTSGERKFMKWQAGAVKKFMKVK